MYLESGQQLRARITVKEILQGSLAINCEELLRNNLNFVDHLTCSASSSIIDLIFNPPEEITDNFLLEIIIDTIRQAGLTFVNAIISQYVGNTQKTFGGSAVGTLLGAKFGILGAVVGALAGAVATKALFDWKDLCICADDGYGTLVIKYLGESQ